MVLKILVKFPSTLVLAHGWLFPARCRTPDDPMACDCDGHLQNRKLVQRKNPKLAWPKNGRRNGGKKWPPEAFFGHFPFSFPFSPDFCGRPVSHSVDGHAVATHGGNMILVVRPVDSRWIRRPHKKLSHRSPWHEIETSHETLNRGMRIG